MILKDAKIDQEYRIDFFNLDKAIMRRLEALGLTRGTQIRILNRSREGAVILKVRGSRLALGGKITETIHLKEVTG